MARAKSRFVCQACGAVHPRWSGRCEACGEWNAIVEEAGHDTAPLGRKAGRLARSGKGVEFVPLDGKTEPLPRRVTGIQEFDRVAGGGLVRGSALDRKSTRLNSSH